MPTGIRQSPIRGSTPRNRRANNHTAMSMRDVMKIMVKEVLEQKRLVPVMEEQPRKRSPFTENILGKPQMTPYANKDNLDDHL